MKKVFNSKYRNLLPLIGLGLMAYLLWKVGLKETWETISRISLSPLLLMPLLMAISFSIQTFKWRWLLVRQGFHLPFFHLLEIQMVAFFYGLVTPARVGYFVKVLYLKDVTGRPLGACSTSVVIDRFLDTVSLLFFATVGASIMLHRLSDSILPSIVIVLMVVGLGGVLILSKDRSVLVLELLKRLPLPTSLRGRLIFTLDAFYQGLPNWSSLVVPFILALVNWGILYTQMYNVALALAIDVDYWGFIFIVSLSTIPALLPVTISGLGTREVALIALLAPLGVSSQEAVAMSLVGVLLVSYVPGVVGAVLSFRRGEGDKVEREILGHGTIHQAQ
ncbi:MAG: flippase-like domain-containing protein [Chloroflexi bacterium]|nr:flippase-like domain-containing protein [Chloroflexota bacterium]